MLGVCLIPGASSVPLPAGATPEAAACNLRPKVGSATRQLLHFLMKCLVAGLRADFSLFAALCSRISFRTSCGLSLLELKVVVSFMPLSGTLRSKQRCSFTGVLLWLWDDQHVTEGWFVQSRSVPLEKEPDVYFRRNINHGHLIKASMWNTEGCVQDTLGVALL